MDVGPERAEEFGLRAQSIRPKHATVGTYAPGSIPSN